MAWAQVNGPSSDCGHSGMRRLLSHGITFNYKISKKSTNGTDVSGGQIPYLLFKKNSGIQPTSEVNVDSDPPQYLSRYFATEISREGFDQLRDLFQWSFDEFVYRIDYYIHADESMNLIFFQKKMEKYTLICLYALRLIKEYILYLYPLRVKRCPENESEDIIAGIYEIKTAMIQFLAKSRPRYLDEDVAYSRTIIASIYWDRIFDEAHLTFEAVFHVFFPTSTMKWRILCNVLANVEVKIILFLSLD